jgi:hypothetical protein
MPWSYRIAQQNKSSIKCGRFSNICYLETGVENDSGVWIFFGGQERRQIIREDFDFQPRPLVSLHGVELALHDAQLPVENYVLGYTGPSSYDGQEGDDPSGSGRTNCRTIYGGLLLLFGAALLKTAFYIADGPQEPRRLQRLGWLVGINSFFVVAQERPYPDRESRF